MTEWYYQVKDEVIGPLSLDELKQKAAEGEIQRETLVREGADGEWTTAEIALPEGSLVTTLEVEGEGAAQEFDIRDPAALRSPLSLRPCRDCGQMVSRQANACPNCGRLFHESSMVARYKGEHPVPVLAFFTVLAVAYVVLSPVVTYLVTMRVAARTVENQEEAAGVALLVAGCFLAGMLACAFLGGAVGKPRMAYVTGLFLGLFFGPLGVFAAFAIDKRPQCYHCSSRLDGLARECPYCHARLLWKVEAAWY